jgi:hypothetical protein
LDRENLELKLQVGALAVEITAVLGKQARMILRIPVAPVWAYLVTEGSRPIPELLGAAD